ncbi:MAG: glycosyltransferase family 4 protein [Chloroflexi bacterium]|nr:glycosyltransferase family 4 protein [Chloroflexota bacterium]
MRILQLAPIWETVPPPAYGGTEAVVHDLVEGLIARGHDVTLWASGDSSTGARLRASYPRSLRRADDLGDRYPHDWLHIARALEDAAGGGYDLLHNHAGELPLAFLRLLDIPVLTTMHGNPTADTLPIWRESGGWYNTISRAQFERQCIAGGPRYAGVVYNGINTSSFPFSATKGDFLLFLSRMSEEKAPHLAIEAAGRLGRRLVMAGKVDWRDRPYFERAVAPLIDNDRVVFLGEAGGQLKRELYRDARALLMPLQWDEPFGLVIVEAMACGTPVIAFPRGAAPELVLDGQTGFLVRDVDAMVESIARLPEIDSFRCRLHVEQRFDAGVMTDGYLALYHRILDQAYASRVAGEAVSAD